MLDSSCDNLPQPGNFANAANPFQFNVQDNQEAILPRALSTILVIALLSGCATIIGEPTQLLPLNTTPDGATVTITDETGTEVMRGETPLSVTLEKSDGSYFGGKSYTVSFEKEGFQPVSMTIDTRVSGWYLGGNILFGGLIGWFIVDPLNGDMYTLTKSSVNLDLTEASGDARLESNTLNVVALQNVPPEYRTALVKIN